MLPGKPVRNSGDEMELALRGAVHKQYGGKAPAEVVMPEQDQHDRVQALADAATGGPTRPPTAAAPTPVLKVPVKPPNGVIRGRYPSLAALQDSFAKLDFILEADARKLIEQEIPAVLEHHQAVMGRVRAKLKDRHDIITEVSRQVDEFDQALGDNSGDPLEH